MKTKIEQLEIKITSLKKLLNELGPIHPGSLSKQIRKKNGVPYGEYWHLSYTFAGKGRTRYVHPANLETFKRMVVNFKKFRQISDKIIDLSIRLSNLKIGRTIDS